MFKKYLHRRMLKIQKTIDNNEYPPKYDQKRWKRKNKFCNCYSYVLDVPIRDILRKIWAYPGIFHCEHECYVFSSEQLIKNVKDDLKALNFSYREEDGYLYEGEWRIAIYYIPAISHRMPIGFHFVRQDEDGRWSEKAGWGMKVRIIKEKSNTPPDLSKYRGYHCKTLVVKKLNN